MVQLLDQDIKTREVLDWKGVHVLHFAGSSCSQKTRIFLNLKGIDWVSHEVDLAKQENFTPWFLGINPRGLVPVLVHDGVVHIESNDILTYLEERFPEPVLIPSDRKEEIARLLKEEDDLHLDIRALTMRYVFPSEMALKKPENLALYESDPGTVAGSVDPRKPIEIGFWRDFAKQGVTDQQARTAAAKFRAIYEGFEQVLGSQPYLMGDELNLVDVAWFIYTHRLGMASYPFERLHPRVHAWYQKLLAREEFGKEVASPPPLLAMMEQLHAAQRKEGTSLEQVAGF